MIRSTLGAVCVTLLASATTAVAQSESDEISRLMDAADISGSVIVTRTGETVFSASYGMANVELGVPNTADTKFQIGSVTKQFTSMGILILQDRGSLDVDEAVGHYLSGLPQSWRTLTIHQLLTHTSGIMHSWALPGFSETMAVPTTLDATLERFFDQPLLFEPGSDFTYSGVGYLLLAKVIEELSGMEYASFLAQEVFEPLGMENTGADHPHHLVQGRASGYLRSTDGIVTNAPDIFLPIVTGGGNLYSTVHDLARWDRALREHLLISDEGYDALYRVERQNYAYGWQVGELNGVRVLRHYGGVPGFAALNLRVPSLELDIVILTNRTPVALVPLSSNLLDLLVAEPGPGGPF